jgi:hypothetical protein
MKKKKPSKPQIKLDTIVQQCWEDGRAGVFACEYIRNQCEIDDQIKVLEELPPDDPIVQKRLTGVCMASKWSEIWQPIESAPISRIQQSINWFLAIIHKHKNEVAVHCEIKRHLNKAVLTGEWVNAKSILTQHKAKFGPTLWSLSWDILIVEESESTAARHGYVKRLLLEESTPNIQFFANAFSLLADKTIPEDHCRNVIQKRINQQPESLRLILQLILINQTDDKWDVKNVLTYFDFITLIDRVELFDRVILWANASKNDDYPKLNKALATLVNYAPTSSSERFLECVNRQREINLSSCGKALLLSWSHYIKSDYAACLSNSLPLAEKMPESLALQELIVKCYLYLDPQFKHIGDTPVAGLRNNLSALYSRNSSTEEAIEYLKRFASRFRIFSLSASLNSLTELNLHAQPSQQILALSGLCGSLHSIRNYEYGQSFSHFVEYLKRLSVACPQSEAVKFFMSMASGGQANEVADIPEIRKSFFSGLYAYKRGDYERAKNELVKFLSIHASSCRSAMSPFALEEARRTLMEIYKSQGDYLRLLDTVVESLEEKNPLARHFPFEEIFGLLEKSDFITHHIGYALVARSATNNHHKVSFALRKYLFKNDVVKPSQLITNNSLEKNKIALLFLNVCIPEVMDSLPALDTLHKVEEERVALLRWIAANVPSLSRIAENEILRITQQAQLRDALATVDRSRVVLNIPALREAEHEQLQEAYYNYKTQYQLTSEEPPQSFGQVVKSGRVFELLFVDQRSKRESFYRSFCRIRDIFLESPQFGMEACLSVRIRHGFIVEHIRRSLVELHLAANKNSIEADSLTAYWRGQLDFQGTESDLERLMHVLYKLTENVDSLANDVRDIWIQCQVENRPGPGMFNYSFPEAMIGRLAQSFSPENLNLDLYLDKVFEILLGRTKDNLVSVRRRMTGELRSKLSKFLDDTLLDVLGFSSLCTTDPLKEALAECRRQMETMTVELKRWFDESQSTLMGDVEIPLVAQTAVGMISRLNPDYNNKFFVNNAPCSFKLKGRFFTAMVHIIFFLLDNAVRHSNVLKEQFHVEVTVQTIDSKLAIRVSNHMNGEEDAHASAENINSRMSDLVKNLDSAKVVKEGGSGYAKILATVRYEFKSADPIYTITADKSTVSVSLTIDLSGIAA